MNQGLHLVAPRRPAPVTGADDAAAAVLGARVEYALHQAVRLTGPAPDRLPEHHHRHGRRPHTAGHAGDALLASLEAIGLSGRGGGHFPAVRKWRAVLGAGGGGTVVANGAEGEPASAKDAALLQHRPHLVLDGLACAAEAVGAERAVLWLHEGAVSSYRAIALALAERRAAGVSDPPVQLVTGPDGYLTGESSAIIRTLSGGPTLPAFRRVPAAVAGVGGRPTLVHNVETLARVAVAARSGAPAYRDSTLVTVLGDGRRTVLEVQPTTTVAEAVAAAHGRADDAGNGALPSGIRAGLPPAGLSEPDLPHAERPRPQGVQLSAIQPSAIQPSAVQPSAVQPQAVLLGGYGGTWLPWEQAAGVPLEHRALRAAGAGLGAGIVAPLPADRCGLRQTALVVGYLAASGARQCGPCLFGLHDVADLMQALAAGEAGRSSLRRLLRFTGEIEGRGGCHHPDGVVGLVRSALAAFAEDVDRHVRRGRCLHPGGPSVLPVPSPRSA